MNKKVSNPFVTGGYLSPDYFCNRTNETERLLKAIASGRNVTLISLRRMGKTGLLKHVRNQLESTKQPPSVVYIDLMPTMDGREMINTIASALIGIKQSEKNFFEKALSLLATLRPKLSYDSLTGQPSLELSIESSTDIQVGISHLLTYVSGIRNDLVFMFDEFQQISRYPEGNMEQILRSIIQTFPTIPFIFSGSSKHMLEPMFNAPGRSFYQSAELMYLDKIKEENYRPFIREHFEAGNRKISNVSIARIFEWTRLHTYYVQYVCNLLYESEKSTIDQTLLNEVFQRVLTSYEPLYASYRNLIPAHQFSLLKAIAIENNVDKPTSGAFIQKHRLGSASSVKTSLTALANKEMIIQSNHVWQVYDVFFSRWLEYHFG
jgi:AAA+ ATPase superfamily predicted ATPase